MESGFVMMADPIAAPQPTQSEPQPTGRAIVLVGMMGAGKTAVGRRLARRLGVPFRDADHEIEEAAGCSVADIFERHGEAAFRDGEARVIARLLDGPRMVIATGGGAFMNAETRARIRARAVSIWLRADVDTLVKRTARREHRPLLRDGDPRRILERLARERNPVYAEADLVVDTGDGPTEETAAAVEAALAAYATRAGEGPQA